MYQFKKKTATIIEQDCKSKHVIEITLICEICMQH
jgi:hypothetical protein